MSPGGVKRPVKLVCEALRVERSSYYSAKGEGVTNGVPLKRGPKTSLTDDQLLQLINEDLASSPFSGEGHRKVWARLRRKGTRVGRKRVLRIMRINGLLAPTRRKWTHTDGAHDGTIIPEAPNMLWGTDATQTFTLAEGNCWVFIAVDHYTFDVWADAVKKGNRFAALEPLKEAVIERFGAVAPDVARGLSLRHDHGTQFTSDHYQGEIRWLGIESSPAFVGEPEGNGCAEWMIRQIKEQVLWAQTFRTVAEVREAVREFARRFRQEWIMERLGYLSPAEAHQAWLDTKERVA